MICMKVFKLSKHLWRSKLQHVSSGWGACGGPNDGFHGFYHGLRRSAMRMRVGMGDNPVLRRSLLDCSISVDGNFRFELLA